MTDVVGVRDLWVYRLYPIENNFNYCSFFLDLNEAYHNLSRKSLYFNFPLLAECNEFGKLVLYPLYRRPAVYRLKFFEKVAISKVWLVLSIDDAFCDTNTLDRLGHKFEMLKDVKVFEPSPWIIKQFLTCLNQNLYTRLWLNT